MKIVEKHPLAEGNWLGLEIIDYLDNKGVSRKWESVFRKNGGGAVLMIAELKPSGNLILIRQFRPPVAGVVLEFPAGLIDRGEKPAEAALRELREETGYLGKIEKIYPPAYNSPGLTGEFIYTVLMSVDETAQKELLTDFDDSEDIETVLIPKSGLLAYAEQCFANGIRVDAKVLSYALNRVRTE